MTVSTSLNLYWIIFCVIVQVVIISVLAIGTVVLLRYRTFRDARMAKYKSEYSGAIADAVALGYEKLLIQKPRISEYFRRAALRQTLLENLTSIVGPERQMLVDAYFELGCADDDRWECSSYRWWVRLEALSHLANLRRKELAPLFERLRTDRNSLVAAAALIGLSQLEDRRNNPATILPRLPNSFVRNVNLLLELSQNWAALYGHEWLGQYLRRHPHTRVSKSLTLVLITLRSDESTKILLDVLEQGLQKDEELALKMKAAIISMGDPVAIERLFEIESYEIKPLRKQMEVA